MSEKQHGEMHRIDSAKNTGDNLKRRDAELYILLGAFLVVLGLPVIFGTWYSVHGGLMRAALVNMIAGLSLVGMGGGAIFYGLAIQKGLLKRP